ncbi:MAG TPA: hypothetical protein VK157_04760, partial [Phycisphaerales bacterium]|nr:hypothetical protein [Phycisphaerales bacterium]
GGVSIGGVAQYDPVTRGWSALGQVTGSVDQLFAGKNGELYGIRASSESQPAVIMRWNGTAWVEIAPALNHHVIALNGRLFAVQNSQQIVERVGNAWVVRGSVSGSVPSSVVLGLSTDANDRLLATGRFASVDGVAAANIATFDGATWSSLPSSGFSSIDHASVAPNGTMYAVGLNAGFRRWARLDGSTWTVLGVAPLPERPEFRYGPNGEIFLQDDSTSVHQWTGTAWAPMNGSRIAITPSGVGLLAGGIDVLGPQPYVGVADYRNGVLSSPITATIAPRITEFLRLPSGDVLAAGEFSQIEGVTASNLALWNGSSWSQFAGGTNGPVSRAFVAPDGRLVIQGSFTQAGGVAANGLAFWNGSAWSTITLSNPYVRVAVDASGTIYATVTGTGLFRYENGGWVQAGAYVDSLITLEDGSLFGSRPGNQAVPSIWTGTQWTTVHVGLTGQSGVEWAQLADGSLVSLKISPLRLVPPLFAGSPGVAFGAGTVLSLTNVEREGPGRDLLTGRFSINGQEYSVVRYDGIAFTPIVPYTGRVTHAAQHAGGDLFIAGDFNDVGNGQNIWRFAHARAANCLCDDIDFNNNGVFPEDQDVIDFFNVLAGADCAACNDIDFNNNSVFPEDQDVISFFSVLAGGSC